jgi:hypothetical protein
MGVYKRGGVFRYEFEFQGKRIRESAKTSSKTIARDAERSAGGNWSWGLIALPNESGCRYSQSGRRNGSDQKRR